MKDRDATLSLRKAMRIHTRHTIYTLTDAGDGAFLISGHQIYCPEPVLVTLVETPRLGRAVIFFPVDPEVRRVTNYVVTTPVVMIKEGRDASTPGPRRLRA